MSEERLQSQHLVDSLMPHATAYSNSEPGALSPFEPLPVVEFLEDLLSPALVLRAAADSLVAIADEWTSLGPELRGLVQSLLGVILDTSDADIPEDTTIGYSDKAAAVLHIQGIVASYLYEMLLGREEIRPESATISRVSLLLVIGVANTASLSVPDQRLLEGLWFSDEFERLRQHGSPES